MHDSESEAQRIYSMQHVAPPSINLNCVYENEHAVAGESFMVCSQSLCFCLKAVHGFCRYSTQPTMFEQEDLLQGEVGRAGPCLQEVPIGISE